MAATIQVLDRYAEDVMPWRWLTRFALLHCGSEWLDLLAWAAGDHPIFAGFRLALMAASFFYLLEFARIGTLMLGSRAPGRWIVLPLLALTLMSGLMTPMGLDIAIRCVLGLTSGFWSAWVLWRGRNRSRFGNGAALGFAAVVLALYSIADSSIVLKMPFLPTAVLDPQVLLSLRGFFDLVHGALAGMIAVGFWCYAETVSSANCYFTSQKRQENLLLPLLIVILIVGWIATEWVGHSTHREQEESILTLAKVGVAAIDEQRIARLTGTPADLTSPDYLRLKQQLIRLRQATPGVRFYYLMRQESNRIIFLVDSELPGSSDESPPGQEYREATQILLQAFDPGISAVEGPVTDAWGSWFSSLAPIFDDSGRPLAVLGVDITAKRWLDLVTLSRLVVILIVLLLAVLLLFSLVSQQRNRAVLEALREREQRLSKIASQVPGMLYQFKMFPNGHASLPYVSEGIRSMFQLEPEQVRDDASAIFDKVHPDDLERLNASIFESAETLLQWKCEFRILSIHGAVGWRYGNALPQSEADGSVLWHGFITDITEQKQYETMLNLAKETAETANRTKGEFLANMSHEIRTPMNGVIGMTGLLLDSDLSTEQRQYAEIVRSSAESLLVIINEILDFSKIEAGKLELEMLDFDLRTTMEDTAEMLAVKAQEKGLELNFLIDLQVPLLLRGDPGRLRQILINLVGNAVKFTNHGHVTVRIDVKAQNDQQTTLLLRVSDTGVGIPPDRIAALFAPFIQVDGSTTRKYGGTGLGLAISKQLVELMGGQIGVDSVEGQGSTFWFTVVLDRQTEVPLVDQRSTDLEGMKVLVVDDHEINRLLVTTLLNSWHCRFAEAVHADEALRLLRQAAQEDDPFHVALVDMQMPEVDGAELSQRIRACPELQDIPLIMMTSMGQRGDAARFQRIGFAGYFTKPVRQSHLRECLAMIRGRATQARELATDKLITRYLIAETAHRRVRILLAEDNMVNQRVALAILKKLGYRADAVANGKEVLVALQNIPYDLVLMDCQMPEMDGYEATRLIRATSSGVLRPTVPIVAMTANAMKGDRERCLEAGMDDYISKPVQPHDLANTLERWLGGSQQGTTA
ncbi:MAG: response regulator [Phycisphaerales bacterium]|nr:response regulator [Phycisphaerales bacterium]